MCMPGGISRYLGGMVGIQEAATVSQVVDSITTALQAEYAHAVELAGTNMTMRQICAPFSNSIYQNLKTVETVTDIAKKQGREAAQRAFETVENNPGLVTEGAVAGAVREISDEIKKGGTVWEFIKATDPMYTNTRIPKSFELTIGNQKFWVHPNATDHMWEYLTQAKNISHGMPMNSQSLLNSFKSSVEKAIESGIQYTQEPFVIDCWELQFSPPRSEGLLPVIKHAMYKPKGF